MDIVGCVSLSLFTIAGKGTGESVDGYSCTRRTPTLAPCNKIATPEANEAPVNITVKNTTNIKAAPAESVRRTGISLASERREGRPFGKRRRFSLRRRKTRARVFISKPGSTD